jgi:hypothetical protein
VPNPSLQRRQVLIAISQITLAASLNACSEAEQPAAPAPTGDTDIELLASVSYDLFPFSALMPEMYVRVAERLQQAGNPVIPEGLAQLRAAVDNMPWKEVDEARRVTVLADMRTSPFFTTVRAMTLEVLFRSPEVFAMVGYGGSAIEQGGYINRGFSDIDWLPAQ